MAEVNTSMWEDLPKASDLLRQADEDGKNWDRKIHLRKVADQVRGIGKAVCKSEERINSSFGIFDSAGCCCIGARLAYHFDVLAKEDCAEDDRGIDFIHGRQALADTLGLSRDELSQELILSGAPEHPFAFEWTKGYANVFETFAKRIEIGVVPVP